MGVVYCIRNTLDDKKYIGSTTQILSVRWSQHKSELRGQYHKNKHLQAAWDKYGEENFEFSVVENNISDDILLTREGDYMREYKTLNSRYGYNKREELGGGTVKFSEETRKAMSESHKGEKNHNFGKPKSEETRRLISEANKGKKHTEESRQKMSDAKKGKPLSGEHRRNMSEAFMGENNPNFGKEFSEEHRRRLSAAHEGIPHEGNMKLRYIVFAPNGDVYAVKGQAAFCRVEGISQPNLSAVIRGVRPQHKGYRARYMSDEEYTLYEPLFTDSVYFVKIKKRLITAFLLILFICSS